MIIVWICWCIVFLILILALAKLISEYKRYGKKMFIASRKPGDISNSDLLTWIVSEHKEYQRVIKIDDGIVLLTESGLYVIIYINISSGKLSGNINSEKWSLVYSKEKTENIDNPFYHFKGDNITNLLVIRPQVSCKIKDLKSFTMDRLLSTLASEKEKLYDKEKIDLIYKDLKHQMKDKIIDETFNSFKEKIKQVKGKIKKDE